jgi:2'-5' RNA ligase
VVVHVPEAEPAVRRWRLEHTYDAPVGMPAHVTLLFPFVPAAGIAEARARLAGLLARHEPFDATFARTARFPDLLFLEPEPADRFGALTEAIAAEWPEHPPYEGEHETVVPHLTVAESEDTSLLDRIAAEVEGRLPIRKRVDAASLFVEDEHGRWHEHSRVPLGGQTDQPGVA